MIKTVILVLFTAAFSALLVILVHTDQSQKARKQFDWVETGRR